MTRLGELIVSILALSILFILVFGFLPIPIQAQSCYAEKTIQFKRVRVIHEKRSTTSKRLGYTKAFSAYNVISSEMVNEDCFVRIPDGWVKYNNQGEHTTTRDIGKTSSTTSRCYPYKTAHLTGSMNVRFEPSVSSEKVGTLSGGGSFTVLTSRKSGQYCWLKKGSNQWVARTGRVQSSKSTAARTTQTSRQTTSCNHPPISHDSSGRIKRAMDYLCHNSSVWHNYVVSKTSSIIGNFSIQGGRAYTKSRRIEINTSKYPITMEMSSVIVHEACHIHQWENGRWNIDPTTREVECIQKMIDYVAQVAPGSHWLRKLQSYIKNPGVSYG